MANMRPILLGLPKYLNSLNMRSFIIIYSRLISKLCVLFYFNLLILLYLCKMFGSILLKMRLVWILLIQVQVQLLI